MADLARPTLDAWANFYVIVGSSAGALTGLQFVVLALVADRRKIENLNDINAFATPTIVHFCCVLALAAILAAPWSGLWPIALALGILGVGGLIYMAIVARRLRASEYKPVLEDTLWHLVLPTTAYGVMVIGAVLLPRGDKWMLFVLGGAALALLFGGIRNAWDTVTFIVSTGNKPEQTEDKEP